MNHSSSALDELTTVSDSYYAGNTIQHSVHVLQMHDAIIGRNAYHYSCHSYNVHVQACVYLKVYTGKVGWMDYNIKWTIRKVDY